MDMDYFDQEGLAEVLLSCPRFALSQGDCEEVRRLYRWAGCEVLRAGELLFTPG